MTRFERFEILCVVVGFSIASFTASLLVNDLSDVNCAAKCRCKLPQIFIDENTDIPNNPLKPMTVEEFQKLQEELRKRSKPEVGDGL